MRASGTSSRRRRGCGFDRADPVVDPEHLALTQQLAPDGFDGDTFVVLADVRQDRLTLGRWCLQQREVADTDEAHLERARDGCGGEREDVDVRLHLLHLLLVLHPETLLFVDDEQAEILEVDVGRQQAMRADDAVDLAGLHLGDDLLRLGRRQEPRQHLDADRVAGEPVRERVAVLGCQQRRRREHGDLLAVLDCLEGGTDRDLGLAESHVATDQSVHRELAFHVGLDVDDRLVLVGRLDERERIFHLGLPRRVLSELVADGCDPLLVEQHQFLSDLADLGLDLRLRLGEVGSAELVELRRFATDVLTDRVDLVGRDVELVATPVAEQQVVAFDSADGPLDHPVVLTDAVLMVHDVAAGLQVLERARRLASLAGARLAVRPATSGEVRLGDDRDLRVVQRDATVQRCDHDRPSHRNVRPRPFPPGTIATG